jgi:hypothetical protein
MDSLAIAYSSGYSCHPQNDRKVSIPLGSISKKLFSVKHQMTKLTSLLFFLNITALAQGDYLQPLAMQQDLDHLKRYIRKWHPTYDDYTSQIEWDSIYKELKKRATSPLSLREFSLLVRQAVAKVGCGHMYVYSKTKNDSLRLMPLTVWVDSTKLFVRSYKAKDTVKYMGSEIISINAHPSDSIINAATGIIFSDGYNATHKLSVLERDLGITYYRLFGAADKFVITLQTQKGTLDTLVLNAVLPKHLPKMPVAGYRGATLLHKGAGVSLFKANFDSLTRVMDIDDFDAKGQRKSSRLAFKSLNKDKIENLVLDLRDNGGGSIFKGNYLLTHLLDQQVVPFVITRKPNLLFFNPRFKAAFWERITPILFTLNPIQFPSKHGWNHAFLFKKRGRNHFNGSVYVLTNGGTFSMASLVASYLKHKRSAIIIGQETGGSEYASRSSASGIIVLPNSKLHVEFNVYQTIHQIKMKDSGHGVMPDHKTYASASDRLRFIDVEFEKAKQLIVDKKAKKLTN